MNFIQACESLFNEIQNLRKDLKAGRISPENYSLQMGGIAEQCKQQQNIFKFKRVEYQIKQEIDVNLIGYGSPGDDEFICPGKAMPTKRNKCLEISSGEKSRLPECEGCTHFVETRRLMLPEAV